MSWWFKNLQQHIDPNDKWYFATSVALTTAYPTGQNGWFAIVGATDTVWVWDSWTNAWIDTWNSTPWTVTTVSVVSANGMSWSVANPTTTPSITLSLTGLKLPARTNTNASDIITTSDYLILENATGWNIIVDLPTATSATWYIFVIKKIDSSANTVTIDWSWSETIDWSLTQVIGSQYQAITIQSNWTAWYILSKIEFYN